MPENEPSGRCCERSFWTPRSIARFTAVVSDWPGDDGVTKRYTFTRGTVLVHLCTHGTHHRAQCLNMLRHLNVPRLSDKLPDPSAVDWQAETESPPVAIA